LIAVAEPRGEARLSGFEESKSIAAGFLRLEKRGLLQATVVQAATLSALRGALRRDRYDVLHFVGHGGWDAKKDRGFLLFEGDTGEPRRVAPDQLVSLLRARGLRLLVLNACESGRGSRSGVAPALLAAGLPAVLANQYPVFDRPAASFAERFYAALGQGRSLSDAVHTARISIARDRSNSPSEWAVPVLYARDPTQRLCAVPRRRSRAAALVADGIES
jgi:CHAT domain-containing protein